MTEPEEKTLLILEDSDEDFDTDSEAMRRLGNPVRIVRATTGDECLRLLQGTGDSPALKPEFVLLDLNTPSDDGRDTLHAIKTDPQLRQLPVVVLTTSSNPRDLDACYSGGANAYHVKPLRYPEHLALLEAIYRYWLESTTLPIPRVHQP